MKNKKSAMFDIENDKKLFAFLAVLLSIIGFIIALLAKKNDKYVMYYAKESLIIFIIALIIGGVSKFMEFIPLIGNVINFILMIFLFVIWIVTMVYSLSGKEKPTPLVIDFAKMIKL